jgi:hypothetical protein
VRKLTVGSLAAIAALAPASTGVALARKKGEFFIQGANLTKQANGSWSGPATLDGVKGTVRITGTVLLLTPTHHTIHWTWVAGTRRVAGCSLNLVTTHAHDVQLWDGTGRITKTSVAERKYQGRHIALYGPTRRDDLTHAKISIREFKPAPGMAVNCP